MGNEKYLNYYIETLTATLTDAIIRNISMQANSKVTEEVIGEQAKKIDELTVGLANKNTQVNSDITKLNETINNLNNELNDLRRQRNEFESVKSQAQHVETFRNELVKERENHEKTRNDFEQQIKVLNERIEYLQLTPAKRKKIDDAKQSEPVNALTTLALVESTDTIKDGGSF